MDEQQNYNQNTQPTNANFTTTTVNIPEEYRPIGMWGYFGYELLFAIPCIGFIILIIFAFGGTRNINVRNFARSYFCFIIIGLVIGLIIFAIAGLAGISFGFLGRSNY